MSPDFLPRTARPAPLRDARRRSTIKLLYGRGIASPGLAKVRVIVHMVSLYNILTDTEPPRARPGPSRPSSSSGGPPAAARCGGVTNPNAEHRDAVGRSEAQVGECIAHPGLSPGPINRRLRRRAQELLFTPAQTLVRYSEPSFYEVATLVLHCAVNRAVVFTRSKCVRKRVNPPALGPRSRAAKGSHTSDDLGN